MAAEDRMTDGDQLRSIDSLQMPSGTVSADSAVVQQWENGLRQNQLVHFRMAEKFAGRDRVLGVLALVLTTVVGTAIFATLESDPDVRWQLLAGLLSLLAAVMVALQTFMDYSGRAATHRSVATGYSELRRLMEQERLTGFVRQELLTGVRKQWTALEGQAPPTPRRLRAAVLTEIKSNQPGSPPRADQRLVAGAPLGQPSLGAVGHESTSETGDPLDRDHRA